MKINSVLKKRSTYNILLIAFVVALAFVFVLGQPQLARADRIIVPPVPDNVKVDDAFKVFLVGHAIGTQNYICLPSGAGFAWTLFTPQATLFDDRNEQIITHFFSPNPVDDVIRATWISSQDSSIVWAKVAPDGASTDPQFVAQGAIAWLKLVKEHTQLGPTGGDKFFETKFVQRLNTVGGSAPFTGCASLSNVGSKAFVPYQADYFFYR